jgi:hypothetical protein
MSLPGLNRGLGAFAGVRLFETERRFAGAPRPLMAVSSAIRAFAFEMSACRAMCSISSDLFTATPQNVPLLRRRRRVSS